MLLPCISCSCSALALALSLLLFFWPFFNCYSIQISVLIFFSMVKRMTKKSHAVCDFLTHRYWLEWIAEPKIWRKKQQLRLAIFALFHGIMIFCWINGTRITAIATTVLFFELWKLLFLLSNINHKLLCSWGFFYWLIATDSLV